MQCDNTQCYTKHTIYAHKITEKQKILLTELCWTYFVIFTTLYKCAQSYTWRGVTNILLLSDCCFYIYWKLQCNWAITSLKLHMALISKHNLTAKITFMLISAFTHDIFYYPCGSQPLNSKMFMTGSIMYGPTSIHQEDLIRQLTFKV